MSYDFTLHINTEHFEIGIDQDAVYGYFEHNTLGDECGGGLWFERQEDGLWELTDYDGVAVLPKEVIQALRENRIVVDPLFE